MVSTKLSKMLKIEENTPKNLQKTRFGGNFRNHHWYETWWKPRILTVFAHISGHQNGVVYSVFNKNVLQKLCRTLSDVGKSKGKNFINQ